MLTFVNMIKIKSILTGWARKLGLLSIPVDLKELSQMRLRICEQCSWAKSKKLLEILNGNTNLVNTLICTKCTCPCLEKSLVRKESCPINKW